MDRVRKILAFISRLIYGSVETDSVNRRLNKVLPPEQKARPKTP